MTDLLRRRPDWPERLHAALAAAEAVEFAWGRSDCFTLAMDVVEALTGADPWSHERGRYASAKGAAKRLARVGYSDLGGLFADLGEQIHPSRARRGDLGLVRALDRSRAAVVCDGHGWVGRRAGDGLVRLPRAAAAAAYRIG